MSTSYFSKIFGKSPVTPLQGHIDKVLDCVRKLVPYFDAVTAADWPRATRTQQEIEALEHDADEIKNELRLNLPVSLFMPMDRRDILEILDLQDSMANIAKDISGLVLGRKMAIPAPLQERYHEFLHRCIDAASVAREAVNRLDELLETGFRGDEAVKVREMIRELHRIEDETDAIQVAIRADLYTIEADLPPVDVMFLYQMFNWTGDLADAAQSTGNRLQLILAK